MENLDKDLMNLPKEKFNFANSGKAIHDKELVTKPISYFRDAFNRFKRNKGSIFAAVIIIILVVYSIIAPILSPYSVSYNDTYYTFTLPKIELFDKLGFDFMDGCTDKEMAEAQFLYYYSMGEETGHLVIKNNEYEKKMVANADGVETPMYSARIDTYHQTGVVFRLVSSSEYQAIQAYQDKTGIQVIYPITETKKRPSAPQDETDANYWFKTTFKGGKTLIDVTYDEEGNPVFENIYRNYTGKDGYTSSVRIEGETPAYDYARKMQGDTYEIRVNYYEFYIYNHKEVLKDGIDKPSFIFGTNASGQDIFTCLASGARFSFIFAIVVAVVNLVVGAIYGAIEGYYGGKIDLIMERIVELLSSIPFMIVITLLKYHMSKNSGQVLILFIAFFLTGWIGMAGRTRMQFYRFKNQEYVLAARTLGASDKRIMFKHIFPNSLGTLITGCVLIIPSMIFSETSLSYLGIINLNTGNRTSVGTLLASGQAFLVQYPHIVLYPAIFISLLMLSFNLFGNGLRDAFNPSLRGSED